MLVYSGSHFDIKNYKDYLFPIREIAHALSMLCRFNGHTSEFYSVAQHSVIVANSMARDSDRLLGLLHDSAEAYMGDMVRPLKELKPLKRFSTMEDTLLKAILARYNVDSFNIGAWERVHQMDQIVCKIEMEDLFWSSDTMPNAASIVPLQPYEAERAFLEKYEELACL